MNCIVKLTGCVLLSATVFAHAGWYENTAHSRSNCMGFNESITWNGSASHWWEVTSVHFRQKGNGPYTHNITDWMRYTWRSAAFDFWQDPAGANADQYWVQGYHYYMDNWGTKVYDNYTQAGDCAIYDGWWDRNVANEEKK